MAPVAGETVAEGAACREIALVEQVRCVDRGRPSVPVERHQRVNKGVTGCLETRCWSRRDCVADIANASADAQGHVLLDRTSVVSGEGVSVRVNLGGLRRIKKKK